MKIELKINKFWAIYFLYRCFWSIFAQLFIPKMTILGDASQYQTAELPSSIGFLLSSTALTKTLGSLFSTLAFGNEILINLCFQILAFIGIYIFVNSLEETFKKRIIFFLLLPSFNMWTSIASKEALVVLALGIVCSYIVSIYNKKAKLKFYHMLGFYLLLVMKPQFFIAILYLILGGMIVHRFKEKNIVLLFMGLLSLIPLYIFKDQIDSISQLIYINFETFLPSSTRENIFFVNRYDIFWNAPYGMFISFFGPTFNEALTNPLRFLTFFESTILCIVLICSIYNNFSHKPVYNLIISFFALFWILFVTYPLGIFNPGSAVRYRADYYLIVVFIVIYLYDYRKANLN